MKTFLLVLLSVANVSNATGTSTPSGKTGGHIYDLITGKNLFTIEAEVKPEKEGATIFSSRYFDADSNEAMTEEAYFYQTRLQRYKVKQSQLNEIYELNVSGKKLTFTVQKNGETRTKTKAAPENLVVGPSFVPFFQAHWKELTERKKVIADLAVMDYMDTFGFEFEKVETSDNVKGVTVRMRPTSVIVSAVVDPVYFLVQNDGTKILELKGQMLVKLKVGNSWQDFDGRAVFTY